MMGATTNAVSLAVSRLRGARTVRRYEQRLRRQIFRRPPRLTMSEWADRYRHLSPVASAEPGKWRTDRAPFQRGIMDTISDPTVQRVAVMGGSQWGKSEILINSAFYFIHQDPGPMLMVRPSIDDARDFSQDRITANVDVTPEIRRLIHRSTGRRDADDKILRKSFPGGHFTLVGSNSATGVSSRPIRFVLLDEIDKYPPSASKKGDPVAQAGNRTKTFWNRKVVLVSTPSIKGASRIEQEWKKSDQRYYFVPCPHCDHSQALAWRQMVFDDAAYSCEGCGALIEERHKPGMLERGEWRATNPAGEFPGFHLSALYSPWVTWAELITKFIEAKKFPDTLQVFVNEDLAELWDPQQGEGFDDDTLKERRETYAAEVPRGVGVLVAFVDVQREWLELAVKGFGAMQESWLIAHHRLRGSPKGPDVWERLDVLLTKGYAHESGATIHISLAGVDSGDGETVDNVYAFVAPRQKREVCPVYATKGTSVKGRPLIAGRPGKRNKYGVRVFPLGSDAGKALVFQRLGIALPESREAPPGYMHFPNPQADGADDEYLAQFGRVKVFTRHYHGVPVREYHTVPKGARDEAVDLEVGCLYVLHVLGAGVYDHLGIWADRVNAEGAKRRAAASAQPVTPTPASPRPPAVTRRPPRPGGGWRDKWRR